MKIIITILCILTLTIPSVAGAYKRDARPYQESAAEEPHADEGTQPADDDIRRKTEEIEKEGGGGMGGMAIMGYALITVGSMAAIAGSTILAATDKNLLGASISGGGAAMALAGTLMVTLGSRGSYAAGPAIDPATGTYGVMVAKRF
ncbi:MAG: hypothetical protein WC683_16255 [bacterium]